MKDLGLSKKLLDSVSGVLVDSSKVKAEESKVAAQQLSKHYVGMGAMKPLTREEAQVASYAAKAPERRVNDAISQIYSKSVAEANAQAKEDAERIQQAYAKMGSAKPLAEALTPKQKKIDKNKNGQIDAYDLKTLRDRKSRGLADVADEKIVDGEQIDELNMDTPGNSYQHQCAVHVKHSKLGEGRTLYSQHAEPDETGFVAWYDVMFEEGIIRVNTKDIEVLESCSHDNHTKKKKK